MEQWRQPGAAVPLGELADVRVTTGPPMIKDENGVLVGYVFADIDQTQRDLGGWVDDAKAVVASQLALPAGYRLQWTGQYEFLAEMEARLRYVIPLTLVLVVVLLYLSMRGWPQTFLVLSSLPFAVAGSVWLLAFMDYNLSTAVWVGLIAVAGVAAETGIVMVVYLDEAFERYMREGRIHTPADVDAAVVCDRTAGIRHPAGLYTRQACSPCLIFLAGHRRRAARVMHLGQAARPRCADDASLACSGVSRLRGNARGARFRDRIAIVVKAPPAAIFQALHEVTLRDMKFAWLLGELRYLPSRLAGRMPAADSSRPFMERSSRAARSSCTTMRRAR